MYELVPKDLSNFSEHYGDIFRSISLSSSKWKGICFLSIGIRALRDESSKSFYL